MRTRIKYKKRNNAWVTSNFVNYEGEIFSIHIDFDLEVDEYRMMILDENGEVYEYHLVHDVNAGKRIARSLLIDKYNVRLTEEVRGQE